MLSWAHIRPVGAAALALTVALGLSSCGSEEPGGEATSGASSSASPSPSASKEPDKPSAKDLFSSAKDSALAAKSGRISGTVIEDGEPMTIDLAGTADGSNQEALISTPEGAVTVRTVGGKTWMSADEEFWLAGGADEATTKDLVGKFSPLDAEAAAELSDLSLGSLLTVMLEDADISALQSMVTDVTAAKVGSTPAWSMGEPSLGQVLISVETQEILQMVSKGNGDLTFSEWNAVKPFTAPAKKDIVEF